jgi:hypothetical protein
LARKRLIPVAELARKLEKRLFPRGL